MAGSQLTMTSATMPLAGAHTRVGWCGGSCWLKQSGRGCRSCTQWAVDGVLVVVVLPLKFICGWNSRRPDCQFADALSPSVLKHLLKVDGVQQNVSLADG